jgi:hypothetical protein
MNQDENTQVEGTDPTPTPGALAKTGKQMKAKKPAPKGKQAKAAKAKPAPKPKGKTAKVKAGAPTGLVSKVERPKIVPKYRKGKKGEKTAGGNVPIDCNDKVATALRGKDIESVYKEVAKALAPDISLADLKAKYGKLNLGMQRMNLGNRLRGALNAK